MKIAVLIKRVPDTASVIKIGGDNKSIVTDNLKYVLSPYDEHAVEEAVKIKESSEAEVVVVSAGGEENKETIRVALAMGADRGILVKDEALNSASSKGISKALAAAVKTETPDLVFAGKQAVDDDAAQVPERVGEILGLPHVSVITRLELKDKTAVVDRDVEGGKYTIEVELPTLFTMEKAINTPRYPALPNIMKAKKKEIKEVDLSGLGLLADDVKAGISIEGLSTPKQERKNKMLEGDKQQVVQELIRILKEDEKVL
jgi:electron transfer flavoprotein beta subunit